MLVARGHLLYIICLSMQESWENIGSSRMAYDMSHDEGFPERKVSVHPTCAESSLPLGSDRGIAARVAGT